ncbi:ATP-binding protein [Flavobacterium sp. N3904]|uniref:ATP-binding protein n=1 Tax=Flavobacterium sp. N3904 TaxID=2986835 RepID=UPI0022245785|nr:ATP-binding protein [Flavobacterium sp. N3904]
MENFRVIGLKIEDGCNPKIHKVLEPKVIYYFYTDIKIDEKSEEITINNKYCKNLYELPNVHINISAIAGKNGSGKSTIIDLLFMIINNLSYVNKDFIDQLDFIEGLQASLYFETDNFYKLVIKDDTFEVFKYTDNKISETAETDFELHKLFYTVAINYSQYALNSLEIGNWIGGLFHKNDGYQIPIVINPMRTEGNFDINTENNLAKSRLITNLVRPVKDGDINFRIISENLIAKRLKLTSNNRNLHDKILYTKIEKSKERANGKESLKELRINVKLNDLKIDLNLILNKISEVYDFKISDLGVYEYEDIINPILKISLDYLVYKLVNIALVYPNYSHYFDRETNSFVNDKFESYLKELLFDDKSHIGFKIKQTLNFLKYHHYSLTTQSLTFDSITKKIDLLINNSKNDLKEENRIELIPPPIFKTEIILETIKGDKETVEFHTLSSGEKQLIYSVSSILYHLINLDSVGKGIKYSNVNIVLDEIELYFHPDFQRKYIKYILDSISVIKFNSIKNINFCFITHSPFILSDIPTSNVMFLELNQEKNKFTEQIRVLANTFSANIHDLLAQSFFLKNGYMGEFAIYKIKEVISKLDIIKKDKQNISDALLKEELIKIKDVIDIIGEPILRQKLNELFDESTIDYESTEDKISRLEFELSQAKEEQKRTNS